jgi:hypothetical protein
MEIKTDYYALISTPLVAILKCTFPLKLNFCNAATHPIYYLDENIETFFL